MVVVPHAPSGQTSYSCARTSICAVARCNVGRQVAVARYTAGCVAGLVRNTQQRSDVIFTLYAVRQPDTAAVLNGLPSLQQTGTK